MQQPVNAADIHEGTEIGNPPDNTFPDLTFLKLVKNGIEPFLVLFFQVGTTRNNDIVTTLVELDDFKRQFFLHILVEIPFPPSRYLRSRNKTGKPPEFGSQSTLYPLDHLGLDIFVVSESIEQQIPSPLEIGFFL